MERQTGHRLHQRVMQIARQPHPFLRRRRAPEACQKAGLLECGAEEACDDLGKSEVVALVDYVQYARPSDVAIAEKDTGGTNG